MSFLSPYFARAHSLWKGLQPKEQRLISVGALVIGAALVWSVALAPAWRTLSTAPKEHARLDAQLQQMRALQEKARSLQAQPRTDRQAAIRTLEASLQGGLGGQAQMQATAGDAVNVSIRQVPASNLAGWLTQSRVNARAIPRELRITRSAQPAQATPAAAAAPAPKPRVVERRRPPNSNLSLPRTPEAEGAAPGEEPGKEGLIVEAPPQSAPTPAPSGPPVIQWDGTLVLALPAS